MSDSEEENYCFFGKPLEPYDEDSFPKKRPIALEEQVATDAQGRRRFHGAFTGGFSAGFFNTVGSLEGWLPSEFRSTRQEKAEAITQKPEDFMDDEDIGEFGIAPQTVKATKEYSTSQKKRKRQAFSDGPIPGEPVLHSILTSGNETIGYLLLRNICAKARKPEQVEQTNENRVYGCEMPKNYEISRNDEDQYKMPEIYIEFFNKPKSNTFGLGYTGLDKSHINLFKSSNLVIKERNKQKLSISGQAFGVGAFEEDDEDIYVKDDMSKYDFELTSESSGKKSMPNRNQQLIFDSFVKAKNNLDLKEFYPPPTIPQSFTGKHKVKKSRFEPLPCETDELPKRKDMNADVRRSIYGETTTSTISEQSQPQIQNNEPIVKSIKEEPTETNSQPVNNSKFEEYLIFDKFVSSSQPEDPSNILEVVKPMETIHGTEEMKGAVKMKMFGPLTRIVFDWQPHSLLCRRFNVPEPNSDAASLGRPRKRTKNLIFEVPKHEEAPWILKPGLNSSNSEEIEVPAAPDVTPEIPQDDQNVDGKEPDTIDESTKTKDNLPKDITEKINIEQNLDLFKAVFLSSDEESETEEKQSDDKEETPETSEEIKTNLLSDDILPTIKPVKDRILSGVDFSIFNKPLSDNGEEKTENKEEELDPNLYGPKLPVQTPINSQNQNLSTLERKDSSDEEWVEKDDLEHKNRSHKKKHKKHSHKKHKKKKR